MRTGEDSHEDECYDYYDSVFGRRSVIWCTSPDNEELQVLAEESKKWIKENER